MKDHIASIFGNYRPYAFVSSVRFCSCGVEQEKSMCISGGAGVGSYRTRCAMNIFM